MATDKFELLLEYDAQGRTEYLKKSVPGTRPDIAGWQIFKLFYDGATDTILRLAYAQNSPLFEHIADDYLDYKYTPAYQTLIIPLVNLPAGTVIDLNAPTIQYSLDGDQGDLLISEALFNTASFITVAVGTEEFDKGNQAVWQSQTSLKLNKSIEKNRTIIITS